MKTLVLFILLCSSLYSQWLPDVRLTNFSGNSYSSPNGQRNIAANGSTVHVVWYDAFIGNYLIYYTHSSDGGLTWGSDTNLILTNYEAIAPSISVSGTTVHTVWQDSRIGNSEIFYKNSTNDGVSWTPEIRLTDNLYSSEQVSIASSGSNVHVFWRDNRDGNAEVYYKRSTDGGSTWGTDTRLTNFAGNSENSTVVASGSIIHLVWEDSRAGANTEVYYKRSTDNGTTWTSDTRLTNSPQLSTNPSVALAGNTVHIAWEDYRDGNGEIYYKQSTDGGTTWGADMRVTNDGQTSGDPSIEAAGSLVHIVWEDKKDGVTKIYYNVSTNSGISWGSDVKLTTGAAESRNPSITSSGGALHVVWHDYRDGNFEIYYDRNPSGNAIGITNISNEVPSQYTLSQNYPNPFNPVTKIKFDIPEQGFTKMAVYDITGKEVAVLLNSDIKAGKYETDFNASGLSSGVYFYRLISGEFTDIKKMILVK